MTTLAYCSATRTLAADRLVTSSHLRLGEMTKIFRIGGIVGGFCGSAPICLRWADWVRNGMNGECPAMAEGLLGTPDGHSGSGVIFLNDMSIEFVSCGIQIMRAPFHACGSGEELALSALYLGKSPEEAVRFASQLDICTGSDIDVLVAE